MTQKELVASAALLCVIAIFTAFAAGSQPKVTVIGAFAQYLIPAMLTVYLLAVVANARAIMDLLASFILSNRRQQGAGAGSRWALLGYAIAIILVLILLRSAVLQNILGALANVAAVTAAALHVNQPQGIAHPAGAAYNPILFYYTLLIFGVVILVSFGLFFGSLHTAYDWFREERVPSTTASARREAMRIIQKTALNLRLTGNYREAILDCYKQMCNVLSDHGFKIGFHETASEFSNSVCRKLELGGDAVKGLTFLFEEARYSDHEIDDAKRVKALDELEDLERSLANTSSRWS